jgi:hypothetical protein
MAHSFPLPDSDGQRANGDDFRPCLNVCTAGTVFDAFAHDGP